MPRVLVAEDSAAARAVLVKILAADPTVRVVGQAHDGVEAVELTQKLRPDLVTMDVQMPRMGGLEATREIMITAPTPIVIVTSNTRILEVSASLDALRAGALEVLLKPSLPGTPTFKEQADRLLHTVRSLARVRVTRLKPADAVPPSADDIPVPQPRPEHAPRAAVIALAAAAGGPPALARILSDLPPDFAIPVLISQRIAPGLTAGLAAWLASATQLRVKIADENEMLLGRTVYLAPDGQHLGVSQRGTAAPSVAPPIDGYRPSGTYLFESVARAFGERTVAVLLSGEGRDGVEGLRAVRAAGGRVIAEDETSAVVSGMPAEATAAGLVDESLPASAIARRICELA